MRPQVHRAAPTPPAEFARNSRAGLRPQNLDRLEGKLEAREKQQRWARIRADRELAELSALEARGDKLVKPGEPRQDLTTWTDSAWLAGFVVACDRSVLRRAPCSELRLKSVPDPPLRISPHSPARARTLAAVEFLVVGPAAIGYPDPGAA